MLARILPIGEGDDGLVIEPMRRRHLNQAIEIERDAYPRGWSQRLFAGELEQVRDGTRCYLVGRRGRTVLGYAGLMFVVDEAHITNVAVTTQARRQRIATRLLIELAHAAIQRGCESWTLEVRASSTGAQELYRSFGFVPAGIRQNYYDNVEDAIVMWCHDIQSIAYSARLDALERPEELA
jgi:ribosomal-protein-alanine N-acetyltransferase